MAQQPRARRATGALTDGAAMDLVTGANGFLGAAVVRALRTDGRAVRALVRRGSDRRNLAFSSHVGTASMGILLALGLAISMAATLIVLPAWLNSRLRAARPAH